MGLVVRENSRESVVEYVDMSNRMTDPLLAERWPEEIYYRFFIPSLFPNEDKVLYLDSDVLVLSDVMELFEKDLGNHPLAAVKDVYDAKVLDVATEKIMNFSEYLGRWLEISPEYHSRYFNSGVLLMNLNVLRKRNQVESLRSLAHKKHFVYPDQDILNIFYISEYMELGREWNYPAWVFPEGDIHVNILHFIGEGKPWVYGPSIHEIGFVPFGNDIYYKYLRDTPWMEEVVSRIDKNKLRSVINRFSQNTFEGAK
jgi:lipopolysaccharide biosynthesis glycosyltransferase